MEKRTYRSTSEPIFAREIEKEALAGKADLVDGKVPASQLPSYVDDVVEGYLYDGAFYLDSEHTEEMEAEQGKIYIDLPTNFSYRWTGTQYIQIGGQDLSEFVKFVEVSNITTISDEILEELRPGDVVVKLTGNQKHTYVVSYKEEHQGICLTYAAAGYLETVSYDYVTDTWVYNSTDINLTNKANVLEYVTEAPTSDNTDGIKIAILSTEPATKYSGWLYFITG